MSQMFNLTNYIEEGRSLNGSNITGSIIGSTNQEMDDAPTVFLAKLSVVVVLAVFVVLTVMSLIFLLMHRRRPRDEATLQNNLQFLEMVNMGRRDESPVREERGGMQALLRSPFCFKTVAN